jgi:hypothetical protein
VTTSCVETMSDVIFDETNGSQMELVNPDLVDDDEAPCDALQRMSIGHVMPQDPNNQPQEPIQMTLLHPSKVLIKIIMKKKMTQMIKTKRRAMIKGQIRMMETKEKHHHIQ